MFVCVRTCVHACLYTNMCVHMCAHVNVHTNLTICYVSMYTEEVGCVHVSRYLYIEKLYTYIQKYNPNDTVRMSLQIQ